MADPDGLLDERFRRPPQKSGLDVEDTKETGAVNVTPNADGSWLPMPFTPGPGGPKFTVHEYRDYHERRRLHLARTPAYTSGWRRPSAATAARIWSLIAEPLGIKLEALPPSRQVRDALTVIEYTSAVQTAKAAFVVAYDAAVSAAERGTMLTTNLAFDALAECWSDNYRHVRATTPARCSWDMRTATIDASWRDLQRNFIQLGALYRALHGGPDRKMPVDRGVYTSVRAGTRGYTVTLTNGDSFAEYLQILAADPDYRRRRRGHRLLLADDHAPPAAIACGVAAERPYNTATPGPKSIEIIHHLEGARVTLHAPTVLAEITEMEATVAGLASDLWRNYGVDVATLPQPRPRSPETIKPGCVQKLWRLHRRLRAIRANDLSAAKALLVRYDRARAQLDGMADTRDCLRKLDAAGNVPADGHVAIRSRARVPDPPPT